MRNCSQPRDGDQGLDSAILDRFVWWCSPHCLGRPWLVNHSVCLWRKDDSWEVFRHEKKPDLRLDVSRQCPSFLIPAVQRTPTFELILLGLTRILQVFDIWDIRDSDARPFGRTWLYSIFCELCGIFKTFFYPQRTISHPSQSSFHVRFELVTTLSRANAADLSAYVVWILNYFPLAKIARLHEANRIVLVWVSYESIKSTWELYC